MKLRRFEINPLISVEVVAVQWRKGGLTRTSFSELQWAQDRPCALLHDFPR